MAEDVITRILALDSRAEEIIAQARQEATDVRYQTARGIDEVGADLEKRRTDGVTGIETAAGEARESELAKVRGSFRDEAEVITNTSPDGIEKSVQTVLSKVTGLG